MGIQRGFVCGPYQIRFVLQAGCARGRHRRKGRCACSTCARALGCSLPESERMCRRRMKMVKISPVLPRRRLHPSTGIAPRYARIGTTSPYASSYADWHDTLSPLIHPPCVRIPALPPRAISSPFLPGPPLRALHTPVRRAMRSPTSFAPLQAPRPARTRKEGMGKRPTQDEQHFFLRLGRVLLLRRTHPQRGQRPQIRQRSPHLPNPVRRDTLQVVMERWVRTWVSASRYQVYNLMKVGCGWRMEVG
ncbi:hypothetical protein C8R44DRAFT_322645 [Mycena epipterygia]|nr:hypothetical protein C8R44DRAFT_322645 [Mycena epipterygia]